MPHIEFTQYLLPDGRKKPAWIDRPQDIADKAAQIRNAGYRFEMEMLPDMQMISLTIIDDERDHAIEVVPNGPEVPKAVDRMIQEFDI